MAPSRLRTAPARDYRGLKLLALLLVAVLVPSACVLWFMNEAVDLQATASRATLADAYRGQLRLVRGRLNTYWESRIATLESNLPRNAPAAFQHAGDTRRGRLSDRARGGLCVR